MFIAWAEPNEPMIQSSMTQLLRPPAYETQDFYTVALPQLPRLKLLPIKNLEIEFDRDALASNVQIPKKIRH